MDKNHATQRGGGLSLGGLSGYVLGAVAFAAVLHLMLFTSDLLRGFEPFFQGDRSGERWDDMLAFQGAAPFASLQALAGASVGPGEFMFVYPAYLIAGKAGIVVFQVLLALASVACAAQIAATILPWKRAPLILGALYAVLPQNLVYPHQFVTEAIATPFCVFSLYFYLQFLRASAWRALVVAGLFAGLAIFVRPALVFMLPALLCLAILYPRGARGRSALQAGAFCLAALAPMAAWVPVFTAVTGKVGYTSGVANLSWNLRSKAFLIDTEAGLPKPAELAGYARYEDLYKDTGGMGVSRFLTVAAEHPAVFARAATMDAVTVMAKGNASKFLVDYLGVARAKNIKDWRNQLATAGPLGLWRWGLGNADVMFTIVVEVLSSLATVVAVALAAAFFVFALVRPRRVAERIGPDAFGLILPIAALVFATLVSSQLVDHAQARLRNPAELGVLILCGLALLYRRNRELADPPKLASAVA